MPITKNAFIRYQTLDKCLRNKGRHYTMKDLLEKVNDALRDENPASSGVAKRQLQYDMEFMKSTDGYRAPIEMVRDGNSYYYTYEDQAFSILEVPINDTEAAQLRAALAMLSRFEGAPQFEWLGEIMPILADRFKLEGNGKKVMGFDSNLDYEGNEFIPKIFNAIVNHRALSVIYTPYTQEPFTFTFHPHYIKQHNSRWFAFGHNASAPEELSHVADLWNVALDRIESLNEINTPYISSDRDWEEDYFAEIVGVTRNSDSVEEIELWFSAAQAPYIKTKALHRSQRRVRNPDGSIVIKLHVVPNFELEQLILGFGEGVKVIKPDWLVERILGRMQEAVGRY